MAEAIPLPSINMSNKYFCYHCDREVFLYQPSEMLCPDCRGDFLEEIIDDHNDVEYDEESEFDESELNLLNLLSVDNLFRRVIGENPDSPRHTSGESNDEAEMVGGRFATIYSTRAEMLNQMENVPLDRLGFISDIFGADMDDISTMLLNDTEIVGPPPLPKDQIKLLPSIKVSREDVEKEVQCTICMEDFTLKEEVKGLPCSHFYHEGCITPWLERHNTCPNCRKSVEIPSQRKRSKSCPRTEIPVRNDDQRRSSESVFSGFTASSMNPFRFL